MHRKSSLFIVFVLLCGTVVHAQLLRGIARQTRLQNTKAVKADKVVSEEEITSHPEDDATTDAPKQDEPKNDSAQGKKSAAQWKAEIQEQKDSITQLQTQVEKLKSSICFVESNRYVNGAEHNQHQLKKQQQADRLQKQLDSEKEKLETMQESARRDGYGNAVYDP